MISNPPQLLPHDASCVTLWYSVLPEVVQSLKDGLVTFYFYGRIVYFNTLDTDPVEPYETEWLYRLVSSGGGLPFPDPMHREHNTWK